MTNISKVAKITTEVTATYQPLSDLNVAFYNQDINTSILQFSVTRNKTAVPLGKTNVEGYIVLLAADGSRIQDNVTITNELNGVIEYVIPTEFLKHTGKVTGQIYIAVKGRDDVAVMRQFTFDIKNDLLTGFSATTKLEYIKMFYDLEVIINQRVQAIDEAIENGEDYVALMNTTVTNGKADIAKTVTAAKLDVDTTAVAAKKAITDTSNTAVTTVTAKAKEATDAIASNSVVKISDTTNWQKDKIWNDNGSLIQKSGYDLLNTTDLTSKNIYVTGAINSPSTTSGYYKRNVRADGYIEVYFAAYLKNVVYRNSYNPTTALWLGWANTVNESDTANWQKDKITADDGSTIVVNDYDLLNVTDIKNLDAYIIGATNVPGNVSQSGYVKRKYRGGYIEINYVPYNTNTSYRNLYNSSTKVWLGWVQSANQADVTSLKGANTGWLPLTLLNGVTASTACYYRFFSTNGIYYLSLKGTLNTITTRDTVIAKLPATVTAQMDRAMGWVGSTSLNANVAKANRWSVEIDGSIKFTASSYGAAGESGAWNPLDITLTF